MFLATQCLRMMGRRKRCFPRYTVRINPVGSTPANLRTSESPPPESSSSTTTYWPDDRHRYTLPLGYIEHTAVRRPDERAGVHGPQSTQHPEQ